MNNLKKTFYLFITCLMLASSLYAQTGKTTTKKPATTEKAKPAEIVVSASDTVKVSESNNSADVVELKKQFYDFINAYSKIEITKDKVGVLKHMSKEAVATLVYFYVGGKMNIVHTDYASFVGYLDKIINTQGLDIRYEISDLLRAQVIDNTGVIVYVVDYDIKKDGTVWSRGNETVTLTYKKTGNEWKIIQYSIVNMEDEKLRGACICELFGDGTGEYVAKTTIPNGRTYDTNLNTFEFLKTGEERMIRVGINTYRWAKNGDIFLRESGALGVDGTEVKIGTADTYEKQNVIMFILKKHIYTNVCTDIKVSIKKK